MSGRPSSSEPPAVKLADFTRWRKGSVQSRFSVSMLRTSAGLAGMAIAAFGGVANAQDSDSTTGGPRTLAIWTSVARDQPLKTRVGRTRDRDLYLVGVRARWLLGRREHVELAYTADLLPAVISTGMPAYEAWIPPCPPNGPCVLPAPITDVMTRQTAYAAGAVPLGLEMRLRAAQRLAFLLRGGAGLLYFSRPVPDPAEQRLNFMFDVGAAAELRLLSRVGLMVGYSLNHISNAGRGPINPAMDSRMLEFGLTLAR